MHFCVTIYCSGFKIFSLQPCHIMTLSFVNHVKSTFCFFLHRQFLSSSCVVCTLTLSILLPLPKCHFIAERPAFGLHLQPIFVLFLLFLSGPTKALFFILGPLVATASLGKCKAFQCIYSTCSGVHCKSALKSFGMNYRREVKRKCCRKVK